MENYGQGSNRPIYIMNVITIIVLLLVIIAFFFKFVLPFMGAGPGVGGPGGTYIQSGFVPGLPPQPFSVPLALACSFLG